jgi:hypothetical protein
MAPRQTPIRLTMTGSTAMQNLSQRSILCGLEMRKMAPRGPRQAASTHASVSPLCRTADAVDLSRCSCPPHRQRANRESSKNGMAGGCADPGSNGWDDWGREPRQLKHEVRARKKNVLYFCPAQPAEARCRDGTDWTCWFGRVFGGRAVGHLCSCARPPLQRHHAPQNSHGTEYPAQWTVSVEADAAWQDSDPRSLQLQRHPKLRRSAGCPSRTRIPPLNGAATANHELLYPGGALAGADLAPPAIRSRRPIRETHRAARA